MSRPLNPAEMGEAVDIGAMPCDKTGLPILCNSCDACEVGAGTGGVARIPESPRCVVCSRETPYSRNGCSASLQRLHRVHPLRGASAAHGARPRVCSPLFTPSHTQVRERFGQCEEWFRVLAFGERFRIMSRVADVATPAFRACALQTLRPAFSKDVVYATGHRKGADASLFAELAITVDGEAAASGEPQGPMLTRRTSRASVPRTASLTRRRSLSTGAISTVRRLSSIASDAPGRGAPSTVREDMPLLAPQAGASVGITRLRRASVARSVAATAATAAAASAHTAGGPVRRQSLSRSVRGSISASSLPGMTREQATCKLDEEELQEFLDWFAGAKNRSRMILFRGMVQLCQPALVRAALKYVAELVGAPHSGRRLGAVDFISELPSQLAR